MLFRSAHRRRRGVYLGRCWYLQGTKGMLSVVNEDIQRSHDICKAFLTQHGYKPADEYEDTWRRTPTLARRT